MPNITPNPVGAVLSALATAYRHNLVSYAMVPEECQPPRFVVGFGTAAEIRAFEAAVHDLADGRHPDLYLILGEVAALAAPYLNMAHIADPAPLRHMIGGLAERLVVVEDDGPIQVVTPSPDARSAMLAIAYLAVAGLAAWDRMVSPGESGEVVNTMGCGPVPVGPRTDGCPAVADLNAKGITRLVPDSVEGRQ